MERRLPRLAGMLRLAALAMLAVVLVMRLGPVCEAVANASPVASEMAGCEGKPKPRKAPQQAPCSTPCMAVQASAMAPVDATPPVRGHRRMSSQAYAKRDRQPLIGLVC